MRRFGEWLAAVLIGFGLAAGTAPAPADETEDSAEARVLEEVIVTAQKREEPLRDVPISIAVFDGEDLRTGAVLELEDLSAQAPAFTVTEAAISTLVFLRGIGSGINQGFEQSVGLYVDGVYAGRGRQYRSSFLDLARVEVLRGPQGILFGKNTVAGAINLTTAQPTDEPEGYGDLRMDADHGERYFSGAVSGPLSESLAGRLAVRAGSFDGWMFNSVPRSDEAGVDDLVLRGSLRWAPESSWLVTLKAEHSDYDVEGRTTQITDAGSFGELYRAFDPAFEDRFDLRKSVGGIGRDRSDTRTDNVTLTVSHDRGALVWTGITAWTAYDYFDELDVDFGPIPNLFQTEPQDFSQFSQELRVASDAAAALSFVAGAYYERSDLDNAKWLDSDLTWLGLPLPPARRITNFAQDTRSWALFGQLTWRPAERWRVNGGLRYTNERKSADQEVLFADFGTLQPNPLLGAIYAQLGLGVPHRYDQTRSEDDWSPLLSVQYDSSEDVTWYAVAAQGFKAGGFNESEVTGDIANFEFDREKSTTFEAGAKVRLADGAARLDVNLFHTEFDDLQVSTFEGVSFVVGNAARATVKGVEIDGQWLISEEFDLRFSWTWLDAAYDYFPNAACTIEQTVESGLGPFCTQDLMGRPTQYAPKNSGRVELNWQRDFAGGHGFVAQLALTHSDGFFIEQDLDPSEFQPAYQKWDLRIGWLSPSRHWSVSLVARNLGDQLTRHHGSDVPLLAGAHYATTDRPRSVALQLGYRF